MIALKNVVVVALCSAAFMLPSSSCLAQEVEATTIAGNHLPPPDPNSGEVIKEKAYNRQGWSSWALIKCTCRSFGPLVFSKTRAQEKTHTHQSFMVFALA